MTPVPEDGERFRARLLDALPQLVVVLDASGTVSFATGRLPRGANLDVPGLVGRNAAELLHPDDLEAVFGALTVQGAYVGEVVGPMAFRYYDDTGSLRVVEGLAWDGGDDPEIGGLVVLLRDIVGPSMVERALGEIAAGDRLESVAASLLLAVAEPPLDGVGWVVRLDHDHDLGHEHDPDRGQGPDPSLVTASPSLEPVAGQLAAGPWLDAAPGAPLVAGDLSGLAEPLRRALHEQGLRSLLAVAAAVQSRSDAPLRLVVACPWEEQPSQNQVAYVERYARVLSLAYERLDLEARLVHAAAHDDLTGLPNRAAFMAWLARPTTAPGRRRAETTSALLYLDLDGFKPVNDRWGHGAGDGVLVEVGRRMAAAVRDGDLVARLGGDEFAILLSGADEEEAVDLAGRVLEALGRPIEHEGQLLTVGASVGVAVGATAELERLLDEADGAMYVAKRDGRGLVRLAGGA